MEDLLMLSFITSLQKALAGKKLMLLMGVAIVLTLFGVDTIEGGVALELGAVDMDRLQASIYEAAVMAAKAAWNRSTT